MVEPVERAHASCLLGSSPNSHPLNL
jgi:hypothetical protein